MTKKTAKKNKNTEVMEARLQYSLLFLLQVMSFGSSL